jgi:hypothetical protein
MFTEYVCELFSKPLYSKEETMTEKEKEGFEKLVDEAELVADEASHKKEIQEIQEFRKDHLYNGTKKLKHVPPKGK